MKYIIAILALALSISVYAVEEEQYTESVEITQAFYCVLVESYYNNGFRIPKAEYREILKAEGCLEHNKTYDLDE